MERRVPIRELNQQTSAILKEVAAGVAVTITTGGRPVARIVPLTGSSAGLDRLVSSGRARSPDRAGPMRVPRRCPGNVPNVAAALAADRDAGRW